ncbi:MAG TPA: GDP-mannose 4,6-dehydratase, partial [Zoogloea sp.]|nr:GDP-mannose 4,6-dehydratase [Zoogloea sp.]
MTPSSDFWRGKRVLITGHSGFKGSWLSLWLEQLGAQLTGLSLPPEREPSLFTLNDSERHGCSKFCDIRDATTLAALVREARPEIVFHLAAQPLVRASYQAPLATFSTNVLGTVHLLDALRHVNGLRVALMVTTDKVYHNEEWPWPYRETDALGGHDPYSASKAASELVINSYRNAVLQA